MELRRKKGSNKTDCELPLRRGKNSSASIDNSSFWGLFRGCLFNCGLSNRTFLSSSKLFKSFLNWAFHFLLALLVVTSLSHLATFW